MTCRDCLHYEVCYYHDFDECDYFQGKSEWVHLPCKIGTTVFAIVDYHVPYYASIATLPFVVSLYDSIGKTVFLTREEAEKALKEMKEK